MDLNLVVLAGRLANTPETRIFEGGQTLVRLLVTTKTTEPRQRIDVVPVTMWDVDPGHEVHQMERGDRVWVAGAIQRRFWSDDHSRRSRIEVVAHHIQAHVPEANEDGAHKPIRFTAGPDTVADEPIRQRAGLEGL